MTGDMTQLLREWSAGDKQAELLALDDVLNGLAEFNPQHSRIVELRFFGGPTIPETAEALGLSHATVERHWSFARAWLRNELMGIPDNK